MDFNELFPTAPTQPIGIRAVFATTNSITLTWSPAMYADFYVVTWNLGEEETSIGIIGVNFTIPNLAAGSSYIIKVTAHNDFQDTASDIITALTGKHNYAADLHSNSLVHSTN